MGPSRERPMFGLTPSDDDEPTPTYCAVSDGSGGIAGYVHAETLLHGGPRARNPEKPSSSAGRWPGCCTRSTTPRKTRRLLGHRPERVRRRVRDAVAPKPRLPARDGAAASPGWRGLTDAAGSSRSVVAVAPSPTKSQEEGSRSTLLPDRRAGFRRHWSDRITAAQETTGDNTQANQRAGGRLGCVPLARQPRPATSVILWAAIIPARAGLAQRRGPLPPLVRSRRGAPR